MRSNRFAHAAAVLPAPSRAWQVRRDATRSSARSSAKQAASPRVHDREKLARIGWRGGGRFPQLTNVNAFGRRSCSNNRLEREGVYPDVIALCYASARPSAVHLSQSNVSTHAACPASFTRDRRGPAGCLCHCRLTPSKMQIRSAAQDRGHRGLRADRQPSEASCACGASSACSCQLGMQC